VFRSPAGRVDFAEHLYLLRFVSQAMKGQLSEDVLWLEPIEGFRPIEWRFLVLDLAPLANLLELHGIKVTASGAECYVDGRRKKLVYARPNPLR